MKNLFRTVAVCAFVFFMTTTQAQIKFGVTAGLNVANVSQDFKESDWEDATNMKLGFKIGAAVEYGLSDALAIQSGLMFSQKGYKYDLEDGLEAGESVDGYDKYTLNYFEIPIHVAYKISGLNIFAGPYLAYAIGGKNSYDYTYTYDGVADDPDKGDITIKSFMGDVKEGDLGEKEDAMSALDFGLDFGLGYEVGPILVKAQYSLGLGNITPGYESSDPEFTFDRKDYKVSNRVISLSATYFFGN